MDLNDWILALHLISAVALVGALTVFSVMIAALWRTEDPSAVTSFMRLGMVGNALVAIGMLGTIVFGIWLAISLDAYELWDGWVIAAIVLWGIATVALLRSFVEYAKPVEKARALVASGQTGPSAEVAALNRTSTGLLLRAVASAAVVLIVIDMIWKPGA